MASDTLANLRTKVREEADVVGETARHPDAAIDRRINTAIQELYRKLQIANPYEYIHKTSSLSTTASQATVDLPSDWERVISVVVTANGESWIAERAYLPQLDELVADDDGNDWQVGAFVRYAVLGADAVVNASGTGKLKFYPIPQSSYTVDVTYNPVAGSLSGTSDTFEDFGFEEYVVVVAAQALKRQDDLDDSLQERRRQMLEVDINRYVYTRDLSGTRGPKDVRGRFGPASVRERWEDVT